MLKRIHRKLGSAGFAIAIVALIAALGGTALAASAALSGKQKKEVEKIAKKYAGKPGAAGAAGTNGTNGKDGTNGTNGKDGTGATTVSFSGAEHGCPEGGVIIKSASPDAIVCNGEEGEPGETGFTETLPSGKTETGTWAYGPTSEGIGATASISFTIPLTEPLDAAHVHYVPTGATGTGDLTSGSNEVTNLVVTTGPFKIGATISGTGIPAGTTITSLPNEGLTLSAAATASATAASMTAGPPAQCPGTASVPVAEKGNLCIFERSQGVSGTFLKIIRPSIGIGGPTAKGADASGAAIVFAASPTESIQGTGTWAVTAE